MAASSIIFKPSSYYYSHSPPLLFSRPPLKPHPCSSFSPNPPTHNRTSSRRIIIVAAKASESSEQKWVTKGLITESLPNGMFYVRLDNGDVVLGYISGKIRRNSIRMLPGDKVKIEVSRYDSTRGRIVYRIGNKDL
ncbi:hypothetical protein M8C21_019335 [Ambrosia artemisiifolia]|uniref:Translation initiation factor IF-1, chloroplastic n=1 Tax=Ambrosia artemisiifolia TaxID=4212 RepID=A0AAD5G4U7_AMBAR|nr:hypothetical protein M8C21_019335 [Ambrosia artemisiifolia]